ncbi:MAG: DUF4202 domain-containing protein [Acidimicrobiaceae bacterium]|nr:DUF4202 domain-containing protein [Acidimicrobiaceae bacterium]
MSDSGGVAESRAAIDAANADDPRSHDSEPLALAQGRRAEEWVVRLDPEASDALRLAARAHHLRRWRCPAPTIPRAGRATCAGGGRSGSATPETWPPSSTSPAWMAQWRPGPPRS